MRMLFVADVFLAFKFERMSPSMCLSKAMPPRFLLQPHLALAMAQHGPYPTGRQAGRPAGEFGLAKFRGTQICTHNNHGLCCTCPFLKLKFSMFSNC